jgi:CBS domain containing-hemolysin-like protein
MTLLFVYIAIALGVSFLCSILEAVLLSVTSSHVARLVHERPATGRRLRRLKTHIDRPLAAILSLNTIAHTVGAAGVGAEAQRLWGSGVLAVTSAVLTLLILFLSEIIPKTLGAIFWSRLTGFVAAVLPPLIVVLLPLVWLSEMLTRFMKRGHKAERVTRREFAALARLGAEQGVFDASEVRVLKGLLRFRSLTASDVMTPRTVVHSLDERTTVRDAIADRQSMIFSRIPLWEGSSDHVTGYVLKDQLLLEAARDRHETPVRELSRPALMVPATLSLPALFERLLDEREHIAVVLDEYGGLDGVVTMEDVVETLIGLEIVDETDSVEDMRAMARAKWETRTQRMRDSGHAR